ncbi:MAG: metallophosphoesterase [Alistipes sp.]|nr:metallophosphoesterase [Alistipes sp.]
MDKMWIVIPDVHGRRFWRKAIKGNEDQRIIFLGDYLDPYETEGISSEDAHRELLDIIQFKKEHADNVTLLLGNHDLGYLAPYICEFRQDVQRRSVYHRLFLDNLYLFDMVYEEDVACQKFLFSHAGIRTTWLKSNEWLFGNGEFSPSELNELLHNAAERENLYYALADSSIFRGGCDAAGSVVWADVEEFVYNNDELPGYIQIFGHTLHYDGAWTIENRLWCLDCGKGFCIKVDSGGETEISAI